MSDSLFDLRPTEPPTKEQLRAEKLRRSIDRRIGAMHRKFGKREGSRCGQCKHFWGRQYAGRYYKCRIYGDSRSAATDWRMNWTACGKFEWCNR